MIEEILARIENGHRLSKADAIHLYENASLHEIGALADGARRRHHPDGVATYIVDRNINYTNICSSRCRFCAFFREADAADAYVLSREAIFRKIEETLALGGTGILMQGGLHPDLDITFFEELLRDIRRRYTIDLHCFSPPEILHISRVSDITIEECLRRLMAAGLGSLPGGGAEILSDDVRELISPAKCSTKQWLNVMDTAHQLGLKTTATMMFGCGEGLAQRLQHFDFIRNLQDRTGGFVSFIPWTFQATNTALEATTPGPTPATEYLRTLALARIYLDNIPTIQASWVTQGLKIAQVALHFGANDIGSVMIEENVVAATGVRFTTNEAELQWIIRDAGFQPARRDNTHHRLPTPKLPPGSATEE